MVIKESLLQEGFSVEYTSLTLSNEYNYKTKFNFQNTQLVMRCGYNTRSKMRWIILEDRYGNPLLTQTFLKYKKECELNFAANQNNINHYVTLKPKDKTKVFINDYDYLNWAKDFDLLFVGYDYSMELKLKDNIRKVLVGN